jgi:hypothetical protein
MLQRLPSRLRPTCEPVCPTCNLDMKGVNLIPNFAAFSRHIFQCGKCGHYETVFREGETAWKNSSTEKT